MADPRRRRQSPISILDILENEMKEIAARSSHTRSSLPLPKCQDLTTISKSPTRSSRSRQPISSVDNASQLSVDHAKTEETSLADSKASSKPEAEPSSPRRSDRTTLSPRLASDKPRKAKSFDQSWAPTFEELDFPASPVKVKPNIVMTANGSTMETPKQSRVSSDWYPRRQEKTPLRQCPSSQPTMDIGSPRKSSHQRERCLSSPRRRQHRSVTKETLSHRSQRGARTKSSSSEDDWIELLELDTFLENHGMVKSTPKWEDFSKSSTPRGQRSTEPNWTVPQPHQSASPKKINRPSNDSDMRSKNNRGAHHSDTPKPKIKRRLTRKTSSDREVDSPTKQSSPIKSGRLGVAGQAMRRRNQTPVRTRSG